MTQLYIANPTEQRREFHYRVTGSNKLRALPVPSLQQTVLPEDLTTEQISQIIKVNEKYGFIATDDITNSRAIRGFKGLCYSIGKPIPSAKMSILLHANTSILDSQGAKLREQTATVADAAMSRFMQENAARQGLLDNGRMGLADRFSATLQHEPKATDDFRDGAPVNEGFERVNDTVLPAKGSGKKGGRRR